MQQVKSRAFYVKKQANLAIGRAPVLTVIRESWWVCVYLGQRYAPADIAIVDGRKACNGPNASLAAVAGSLGVGSVSPDVRVRDSSTLPKTVHFVENS